MPKNVVIGYETNFVSDINESLNDASKQGFEFLVLPSFHPRYRRDCKLLPKQRDGPGTRSDLVLSNTDWIANVVSKVPEVFLVDLDL